MSILILCVGQASMVRAQSSAATRPQQLWIVDSHGKVVGSGPGNLGNFGNSQVQLKFGSRFVTLSVKPDGFEHGGPAWYESTDCSGAPLMPDHYETSFFSPAGLFGPGRILYLPDDTVPAQKVHLRSLWSENDANPGCQLWDETVAARPIAAVENLDSLFAPPFRLTAGPIDVQHVIDVPAAGATVGTSFVVSGWAIDPLASTGTGIDSIHVWAYRRDINAPPQFLGIPATGILRADVAAIYGPQFGPSGYSLSTSALAPGLYDVVVFHHRTSSGTFEGARTVRVTVQ